MARTALTIHQEDFGSFEFDPMGSTEDAGFIGTDILMALYPLAQADPAGFLRDLAAAVILLRYL